MIRDNLLLEEELDRVRDGLKNPKGANPIGTNPILYVSRKFAFDECQVKSKHWHEGEDNANGT